ncbi:MAG TPA: hypothetical protein VIM86_01375 [Thermodesulfobacteriota bacterium]
MERRQDPTRTRRALAAPLLGLLAGLALLAAPRAAEAQRLSLNVTPASITFLDANPDLQPTIASTPATVRIEVEIRGGVLRPWRLTIVANDHLRAGASVIDASNVSWTSSRTNEGWLAGGTLAVAAPQTMAQGASTLLTVTNSDVTFRLQNRWTYNPGFYTTTATLTLSSP